MFNMEDFDKLKYRILLPREWLDHWKIPSKWANHFGEIQAYCMFLGYPRSGHSLIGAILDAHPNAVISHELDALDYVEEDITREQLFGLILERNRWFVEGGQEWDEYKYQIENSMQGKFKKLQVIGDKKGGMSTERLLRNPQILEKLEQIVRMPIKIIHVVRNPFNVVATMHKRGDGPTLELCAANNFIYHKTIDRLKKKNGKNVYTLPYELFTQEPKEQLKKLCLFLNLPPDEKYINQAISIVREPHESQKEIKWSRKARDIVNLAIEKFKFLKIYAK